MAKVSLNVKGKRKGRQAETSLSIRLIPVSLKLVDFHHPFLTDSKLLRNGILLSIAEQVFIRTQHLKAHTSKSYPGDCLAGDTMA